MARLLKSDLSIKTDVFSFNVKVNSPVTVISGDSSTGKTLWFSLQKLRDVSSKTPFVFINAAILQSGMSFLDLLSKWHNRVVIVDNADIVVPRDIDVLQGIYNSDCQFVFLGRDIGRYVTDYNSVASLEEKRKGTFKLRYLSEGCLICQ